MPTGQVLTTYITIRVRDIITKGGSTRLTVTLSHHNTSHGNQRRSCESPFLCSKKASDRDVATRPYLPIRLHDHATPKVVQNECLMGFGKTEFPRKSGVFNARPARRTGPSVVS